MTFGAVGRHAAEVFWAPYGSGFLAGEQIELELLDSAGAADGPAGRAFPNPWLGAGANRTAWQARVGDRYYAALIGGKRQMGRTDDNVRQLLPQLMTSSELRPLVIEHYAQLNATIGSEPVSIWLTELAAMDLAQWRRLGPEPFLIWRGGRRWIVQGPASSAGLGAQVVHYLRPFAQLLHELHARQQRRTFRYDVLWRDVALDNIALRLGQGPGGGMPHPTVVLDPEAGRMVEVERDAFTVSGGHYHAIVASPADLALSRLIPLYHAGSVDEAELAAAYRAALDHSNEVYHFGRILQQLAFRIGEPDPGRLALGSDPSGAADRVYRLAGACVQEEPANRPTLGQIVAEIGELCSVVPYAPLVIPDDGPSPGVAPPPAPLAAPAGATPAPPVPAATGMWPATAPSPLAALAPTVADLPLGASPAPGSAPTGRAGAPHPADWSALQRPRVGRSARRKTGRTVAALAAVLVSLAALAAGVVIWRSAGGPGAGPLAAGSPGAGSAPPSGAASGADPTVSAQPRGSLSPVGAVPGGYTLSVVAGNGAESDQDKGAVVPGPATATPLGRPGALAADGAGSFYIADMSSATVWRVGPDGALSAAAGGNEDGSPFDTPAGPATAVRLSWPKGLAADGEGNVYIADTFVDKVMKVTADGLLSVIAGNGTGAPEPGPAAAAGINGIADVAVGPDGALYLLLGSPGNVVAKVSPAGDLSIIAGNGNSGKPRPGPATDSRLNSPTSIAVDGSGAVYIADRDDGEVLRVTPDGQLSVLAGNGELTNPLPLGPAAQSPIGWPTAIATDSRGNVYIADSWDRLVLKVDPSGTLSIIAGTTARSTTPFAEGPATATPLDGLAAIAVGEGDSVYAMISTHSDYGDTTRVVKLTPPAA
jgi:hypothetical protein